MKKKMNKAVFALVMTFCLISAVYAEDVLLIKGIKAYKEGDYLGSLQTMENVVKESPGKALAHYYMAMSYVKIGKASEATVAYEKVIFLNPSSQLASYAEIGKQRLNEPESEKKSIMDGDLLKGIQNTFYSDKVKKDVKKRQLELIKDKANNGKSLERTDYEELDDFTPRYLNSKPTQEQVAEAYKTLAKAGINPYGNVGTGGMNTAMNPELLQLGMMGGTMNSQYGGQFGGNSGGNSSMNMLPLLMMMQQGQQGGGNNNVNPQAIQSMMSNMLMPDMMNMYGGNNDRY